MILKDDCAVVGENPISYDQASERAAARAMCELIAAWKTAPRETREAVAAAVAANKRGETPAWVANWNDTEPWGLPEALQHYAPTEWKRWVRLASQMRASLMGDAITYSSDEQVARLLLWNAAVAVKLMKSDPIVREMEVVLVSMYRRLGVAGCEGRCHAIYLDHDHNEVPVLPQHWRAMRDYPVISRLSAPDELQPWEGCILRRVHFRPPSPPGVKQLPELATSAGATPKARKEAERREPVRKMLAAHDALAAADPKFTRRQCNDRYRLVLNYLKLRGPPPSGYSIDTYGRAARRHRGVPPKRRC